MTHSHTYMHTHCGTHTHTHTHHQPPLLSGRRRHTSHQHDISHTRPTNCTGLCLTHPIHHKVTSTHTTQPTPSLQHVIHHCTTLSHTQAHRHRHRRTIHILFVYIFRVPSIMPSTVHCTDLVAIPVISGGEHGWGRRRERRARESHTYI